MRKLISFLVCGSLLASLLASVTSVPAAAATTLITCTDLNSQKITILKAGQKSCRSSLASANWHIQLSDSPVHLDASYATLRTCMSKRLQFDYQLIKSKCAKFQDTRDYWRKVTPIASPVIRSARASGHNSAVFVINQVNQNVDAPIAFYLISNRITGEVDKVSPNNFGEIIVSNLSPLTTYTFSISAVSVDGTSEPSRITSPITTGAVPVAAPASSTLASPAFTLSAIAETRTVNTAASGFTVISSGGAIASFTISATPPGMSFSTSTGALTGTPNTVASATSYTITATNASGTATRTFTLTVTAIVYAVGDLGPAGGIVFYVAATPFSCGPSRSTTCSYLEAAPSDWMGTDPQLGWANLALSTTPVNNASSPETAAATAIGWGYWNTRAIILQGNTDTATSAAALADSHNVTVSGVLYDDWFLPSKDELNQLYLQKTIVGGFAANNYWSSTEDNALGPWIQYFPDGSQTTDDKYYPYGTGGFLRPVRAF